MSHYEVETTAHGVKATGCKAVQPQSNLHSTKPAEVDYTYEVTAPYTALLTKVPGPWLKKAGASRLASLCVPSRPSAAASGSASRWRFRQQRCAIAAVSAYDLYARPAGARVAAAKPLPLDAKAELNSPADRMSVAYRRYLKSVGITFRYFDVYRTTIATAAQCNAP